MLGQLYEHWDSLSSLWSQGKTKTQAEELEELRKKTALAADEAERLQRASELPAAVKGQQGAKKPEQQAEGEAVKKAITEAGIADVARGIIKVAPDILDTSPELAAAKTKVQKAQEALDFEKNSENTSPENVAVYQSRVTEAQIELNRQREIVANNMAVKGQLPDLFPNGRQGLLDLVKKNPGAFGEGGKRLAIALEEADPEVAYEKDLKRQRDEQENRVNAMQAERDTKESAEGFEWDEKTYPKMQEEQANRLNSYLDEIQNSKAEDAIQGVLNGRDAANFLTGTGTYGMVKAELARLGFDPNDEDLAGRVARGAETQARIQGANAASELGFATTDEGRIYLARQRQEQFDKSQADLLTRDNPEIPGLLSDTLKGFVRQGLTIEQSQQALFEQYRGQFGDEATRSILQESGLDARQSFIDEFVNKESAPIQVINSNAALRDSLQTRVNPNSEQMRQVRAAERTVYLLEQLVDDGIGTLG